MTTSKSSNFKQKNNLKQPGLSLNYNVFVINEKISTYKYKKSSFLDDSILIENKKIKNVGY
jgi:hypothetical protein